MNEDMIIGRFQKIRPRAEVAYAWQDRGQQVKKLAIRIDNALEIVNMDKAMKRKTIKTQSGKRFHVSIRVAGNAKKLKISPIDEQKEGNDQAAFF